MYALQSKDEKERMEQQNEWNKEAAAKSQEYAKEMLDYTGYENQVKQMKAAGLNPALLNGGSGSARQAHGATVNPATAMQPMGLQVALQAQQTAAQTALINAEAEKTRSETTSQKVENMIGVGVELAKKVAEIRKNKKDTEEVEQKIENLKKTAEGTVTEKYTSSFPLTEIDDLREYILSKGREEIVINKDSDEKLKSLFIYNILFSPNPEKDETPQSIPPIGTLEMGGLCLKTYQSDLFNNWVNKDWVS